ncbi:hypothetical protein H113_01414 [Trichophyton rubrum MR1459]|uniref:Uncharacterized protein n=1 Tax=Trichophyton rubrum (strain ATCC MYA-4607 / CBS 118892) TaxID=559305 RepID=A0A080WNX9_TRIRC|nr:uncharacterized protein TERG_12508 [Trichophyton rubrum CBS 118892]EZF98854.1 hypothetical protein H113_01414 [Trichophyton rubrum MR1459]KFL62567.1 hypothetical protein TERG_12508 [Trichophyton rubrum CBS 118892]
MKKAVSIDSHFRAYSRKVIINVWCVKASRLRAYLWNRRHIFVHIGIGSHETGSFGCTRAQLLQLKLRLSKLPLKILNLPWIMLEKKKTKIERSSYNGTNLIDDMRRFVSFVKRHLTLRLEHSVQLDESEASHC